MAFSREEFAHLLTGLQDRETLEAVIDEKLAKSEGQGPA